MAYAFIRVPDDVAGQISSDAAKSLSSIQIPNLRRPTGDSHITLLYFGKDISTIDIAKAMVACNEVVSKWSPFAVEVSVINTFPPNVDDGVPIICPVHSPKLLEFRADLASTFDSLHLPYSKKYEYKPHVTLAYTDDNEFVYSGNLSKIIGWNVSAISIATDEDEIVIEMSLPKFAEIARRLI